jgi:uncharacterized protein (TIGR03663 family)
MRKREILVSAVILLVAAAVRIAFLDIKPPHFDEGINGWFCDQIAKRGFYAYDPSNYHGPLHFYVLLGSLDLFGRNLWALRLPVVVVGLLTVAWVFLFKPFFGRTITYLAALGMALSPGFVFYNRYSIHESWLVFFLLVTLWGVLGIWQERLPIYFWGAALGVAGMILTKETYFIHLLCLLLARAALWSLELFRPSDPPLEPSQRPLPGLQIGLALGVGAFLIVLFYSAFFQYWPGVTGLFEAFAPWAKTGIESAGHAKPGYDLFPLLPPFLASIGPLAPFGQLTINWYWIRLLAGYEWLALAGCIFSVRYLFGGPPFLRFLAIYAGGVLLAYSLIPYKTPWCLISIAWPYLFLGPALLQAIATHWNRLAAIGLGLALFGHAAWRSYVLNFEHYDDETEKFVYVQTFREYRNLVDPILLLADRDPGQKEQLKGLILLSSYHPIPWVLGEFTKIGYYSKGSQWPTNLDADFIAVDAARASEVEPRLRERYFVEPFRLRGGMGECIAYFRADKFASIFPDRAPELNPGTASE